MTEELKRDFIWHRALEVPNHDKNKVRKDYAGAIIHWDEYGMDSEYGWTILPLLPYQKGGDDNIMSLIPWHVQNAISKGDEFPRYKTILSSDGEYNVEHIKHWDILREL